MYGIQVFFFKCNINFVFQILFNIIKVRKRALAGGNKTTFSLPIWYIICVDFFRNQTRVTRKAQKNQCNLKAFLHQVLTDQDSRNLDKNLRLFNFYQTCFFFFLRSLPKRKSEVLTQQKMALKIECLKCANMWSLWWGTVKKAGHFWGHAAKRQGFPLHSSKQFTPAIKMKWCLVLWNYLWKIQNNEDLFL